jgi:hypothetical protein
MAFTYDLSNSIGKVRLLIPDTQETTAVFSDEEITAFLALESASVRRATALALETIASNEALTLKVVRLLDVQTDGAKLADSLMKRAATLRQQALEDDALAGFTQWEIAEWAVDDFTLRDLTMRSLYQ